MTGSLVVSDSLSVNINKSSSEIDSSSTFEMRLKNPYGRQVGSYNINDDIQIYSDASANPTTLIFTGIIEDVIYDGEGQDENLTVRGRDYSARLQDRTINPEVYNNLPAGSIVKDIINKYTNNITTNNVDNTPTTINRITFNQIPVYDGIKQLADLAGCLFYVDVNKDLHFNLTGGSSTGIVLDSGNVIRANFEERRDRIFNEIWVYGDRYLDHFQESFTANGTGSIFTLLYNPHNTEVTNNGVIQVGGILNIGYSSGTNYLVNFDDKQIIFVSGTSYGNSIPANGSTVLIKYNRALPVIEVTKDNNSIALYGQRVMKIQDKTIKDPNAALQLAIAKLDEFSNPEVEGNLLIRGTYDFQPNQIVNVNLPNHNINSQNYEVIEVNYNFTPETLQTNEIISLKVNSKLPDAANKIKELDSRLRRLESQDISNTDVITRTELTTGSIGLRTSGLFVETQGLGSSFILSKGYHGVTGSTFGGILGNKDLITNGTFNTDLTGWTDNSGPSSSISWSATFGGCMVLNGAAAYANADQTITTIANNAYTIGINVKDMQASTTLGILVGTSLGASDILNQDSAISTSGIYLYTFTAPGTTTYVRVRSGWNGESVDDIFVTSAVNFLGDSRSGFTIQWSGGFV